MYCVTTEVLTIKPLIRDLNLPWWIAHDFLEKEFSSLKLKKMGSSEIGKEGGKRHSRHRKQYGQRIQSEN